MSCTGSQNMLDIEKVVKKRGVRNGSVYRPRKGNQMKRENRRRGRDRLNRGNSSTKETKSSRENVIVIWDRP